MALAARAQAKVLPGSARSLRPTRSLGVSLARRPSRSVGCVRAEAVKDQVAKQIGTSISLAAVASSWLAAGHANAATELAQLAAGDNRLSTLALLFVPALGWVAFNILQPALNQLNRMDEMQTTAKGATTKRRGVAGAVGLGAALSLAAAQQADAVQEVAQLAGDNRLSTLALLFVPALGWVAFNILQPALNQLNRMGEMQDGSKGPSKGKRRGVAGAVGLGAALSLFAAQQADAAQEVAQLAGDNRLSTLALLFVPALAWVGFNILQPAQNQLNRMGEMQGSGVKGAGKRRGVMGAVGLGAALSLMAAEHADAAQEVAQLAGDNRLSTLALLFVPALGWVAFNILQPAQNQLNRMGEMQGSGVKGAGKRR